MGLKVFIPIPFAIAIWQPTSAKKKKKNNRKKEKSRSFPPENQSHFFENMESGDYYGYIYPAGNRGHLSENRNSGDYYSHISQPEKSRDDGPHLQNNIHLIFKPRPAYGDHQTSNEKHVKFEEASKGCEEFLAKTTTESVPAKEQRDVGRRVFVEEDVDAAAGDFIMRKHKTYEMQKLMSKTAKWSGAHVQTAQIFTHVFSL